MKNYYVVIFIGRFQPFHHAHLEMVKAAYEFTDNLILIIGSQYKSPTYKNPFQISNDLAYWSAITESIKKEVDKNKTLDICLRADTNNDEEWCQSINNYVSGYLDGTDNSNLNVAIIGCNKDNSSYYLKMFPQWDLIELPLKYNLSATQIREHYFVENPNLNFIANVVPQDILLYLDSKKNTEWHRNILNERKYIEQYKAQYAFSPYPPTFVTVDAVVFHDNKILMIRRKDYPGKGLLALPGGFLDAEKDPSLEVAVIRELKEETGVTVSSNSITATKVFDSLYRSSRGRTITHAFKIVLNGSKQPMVKSGSDAESAFWISFSELNPEQCFEDHYQIIQSFIVPA